MDKTDRRNEITQDMTRESLIAISYALPKSDPVEEITLPQNIDSEKAFQPERISSKVEENYRSELISISYSPPPEMLPDGQLAS